MKKFIKIFIFSFIILNSSFSINLWLDLETGLVFPGYNDVKIPADTGTKFSLKDDIKPNEKLFYRIQTGINLNKKHPIFILIAPLTINGEGTLKNSINFTGVNFPIGAEVKSKFVFNSYRLTYLYSFYNEDDLRIGAGITAKIRDAEITLTDNLGNKGTKKNTGFVPLIHLRLEWFTLNKISLLIEGDGLIAPQGRAEDFLFGFNYYINKDLNLKIGYRVLEGGSDKGGNVYTFSMFNYLIIGLNFRF